MKHYVDGLEVYPSIAEELPTEDFIAAIDEVCRKFGVSMGSSNEGIYVDTGDGFYGDFWVSPAAAKHFKSNH